MLLVMGGLLFAVLAWLLVVKPMVAWREDAAERQIAARNRLLRVTDGVQRLASLRGSVPSGSAEASLTQTAQINGLSMVTGMGSDGNLSFRVQSVDSGTLFTWLSAFEAETGHRVTRLSVIENADATLTADGSVQ